MLWGGYHGVLLLSHPGLRARGSKWQGGWLGRLGTLLLVMLGWVIFRAQSIPAAGAMYRAMFDVARWAAPCAIPATLLALSAVALLWAVLAPNLYELIHVRRARPRLAALIALGVLAAIAIMLSSQASPFLYYQFSTTGAKLALRALQRYAAVRNGGPAA